MAASRSRWLAAPILALALGCGPVPGGALSGSAARAPSDWSALLKDGRELCEIEARPQDPHSIQLECFLYEGGLLVQSHRWAFARWWPVESWASIWIQHPDVKLRIDGQLFEVRAVPITDAGQREAVLRYRDYDPVPAGIAVFRFEPRG